MKYAAILAALAGLVKGHGAVTDYVIDGVLWPGYEGFAPAYGPVTMEFQWPDYNPILDCSLSTIRCNAGTSAGDHAVIAAGDKITAQWAQWTHIPGTVTVYLYNCGSEGFGSCDGSGANWFKIDAVGLTSGTVADGMWGPGLVMDTLSWTTTIPASLKAGNYLIRHELMAVHQANTPQFYPECGQLQVTGSGTSVPSGDFLVSIPSKDFCDMTSPSIDIDIYDASVGAATTYSIYGPSIWPAGATGNNNKPSVTATHTFTSGAGGATSAPVTQPATTPVTTPATTPTTVASKTTSAAATSSAGSGACAAVKYSQCGGIGFSGCTSCASGSTCSVTNDYYSQCL